MVDTVILDPTQAALVDRLVAAGRFASPGEAIAAGVSLLLEREARHADLRTAWADGVEGGGYRPIDEVLDELDADYAAVEKSGA